MAKFQQKFEKAESNQPRTPEKDLWISVLSKAAHDAIYTSEWTESKRAIKWFRSESQDFKQVCEMAGYEADYVAWKMLKPITDRESHMEAVRSGNRLYVKDNAYLPRGGKIYHSHYRLGKKRGPYKKKSLTGNSYYAAERKKDPYYVKMGKLGGRPRMYNNV